MTCPCDTCQNRAPKLQDGKDDMVCYICEEAIEEEINEVEICQRCKDEDDEDRKVWAARERAHNAYLTTIEQNERRIK